jgi:aminomethyltransferase
MTVSPQRTPFYDMHVALKGKMVPFAGFSMPVQYPTGITAEHTAVRTNVGIFDVSHMGEFEITGPDRNAFVNRITCNDFGAVVDGQAQYTALLNERGTFIDDCIAYRFDDKVMLVVNAANLAKDWEHVVRMKGQANIRIKNISEEVALLAVQGPNSEALLQTLTDTQLAAIRYYHFAIGKVAGAQCFIARTGYTGEDGFELYFRAKDASVVWSALVTPDGAVPCGLGARDSLRLEVGYPLYGNDIDDTISPYEARLGWIVKLNKGVPFVGRDALMQLKDVGVTRKLVGFVCEGRGAIPRPGYGVFLNDRQVDTVRSGGFSPSLGHGIGTAILPTHSAEPGTAIEVDARGRRMTGTVTKLPFYSEGSVKRS